MAEYVNTWKHPETDEVICTRKGRPVRLQYNPKDPEGYFWCVQYGGNGHYFRERWEATAYLRERRFLPKI